MPTKARSKVQAALKGRTAKQAPSGPLWQGPMDDGPQGGITQSLLSRFIQCRERFRLLVCEGLQAAPQFNHRIQYGSLWHAAEEGWARTNGEGDGWEQAVISKAKELAQQYRESQQQIVHWQRVCRTQFPIYRAYWAKHKDEKARTPVMAEKAFCVPYELPSGRVVYLRGKWDGVGLIGKAKLAGLYLDEHKTKGDVVEQQLRRQLDFDQQTMTYVVALREWLRRYGPLCKAADGVPLKGVRYNVVRRPLAGGKYSISKLKPKQRKTKTKGTVTTPGETDVEFYARLGGLIEADPSWFFARWTVELTPQDIERFEAQYLRPVLEQLCDWWNWIGVLGNDPFDTKGSWGIHWRTPYGFYNVLAEGGSTELDEYLATGSELGLVRARTLFSELEE